MKLALPSNQCQPLADTPSAPPLDRDASIKGEETGCYSDQAIPNHKTIPTHLNTLSGAMDLMYTQPFLDSEKKGHGLWERMFGGAAHGSLDADRDQNQKVSIRAHLSFSDRGLV
jgi:hypothetical protein